MSNFNEKVDEIWNELVLKEQLKNLTLSMQELKTQHLILTQSIREIIREELTSLWNNSEIPILKQIVEQLNILTDNKGKQIIREPDEQKPEMVYVDVWKRCKEPMMVDISKSKPNLPEQVTKTIESLAELHKKGKFQ